LGGHNVGVHTANTAGHGDHGGKREKGKAFGVRSGRMGVGASVNLRVAAKSS